MTDILEGHCPPRWLLSPMEALRHRQDMGRKPSGRPGMWTAEGTRCPYCDWPIDEQGRCKIGCSGGL